HFALDRDGNLPFDLFRRVARPLGVDGHHRRRQIGVSVDRKVAPRAQPGENQQDSQKRDENALLESKGDDAVDEVGAAPWRLERRVAHWLCMNCRNSAPSTTTLSPELSPLVTS